MANWPNNKCGTCKVDTGLKPLKKLTCPKCGAECCQYCAPKAVGGPCIVCGWKFGADKFNPNSESQYPGRR